MVKYWMYTTAARGKVTLAKDGSYQMFIEGEKYPMPGFPRGVLIVNDRNQPFTKFSTMKHEIKNFIFNESWKMLHDGVPHEEIIKRFKKNGLDLIAFHSEQNKYEMLPIERMVPAVREIHRGFTVVADRFTGYRKELIERLRDVMTYILQEDDGYRFRVQWLAKFMPVYFRKTFFKCFLKGLKLMEHAEVVGDMRERITLLRTILELLLEDKQIRYLFELFCEEVNWKKIRLTKADKYYFRAKYFRVDYPEYEY